MAMFLLCQNSRNVDESRDLGLERSNCVVCKLSQDDSDMSNLSLWRSSEMQFMFSSNLLCQSDSLFTVQMP